MTMHDSYTRLMANDDNHDPYALQDPGYNVDTFYTQAGADSSGFRLRISNENLSIISALVASKDIPELKTPADFVRDAIRHRLQYVAKNYKVNHLRERLLLDMGASLAADRLERYAARRASLDLMRDSFDAAIKARSAMDCAAAMDSVGALVDDDNIDDPFQEEVQNLLARMRKDYAEMGR